MRLLYKTQMSQTNKQHTIFFLFLLLLTFALGSCGPATTAAAPCATNSGITILPTLIPRQDPNAAETRDGLDYTYYDEDCGLDNSEELSVVEGDAWIQGRLQNVTLDPQDAILHSSAAGQNNMAIAWTSEGDVYIGLSRGGSNLQIERVDRGDNPDVFFSNRARLHLVYEQDGQIIYRSADANDHPAQSEFEIIDFGAQPQVAVDPKNWSHVIYEQNGQINHSIQMGGNGWWINPIGINAQDLELFHSNDLMVLSTVNNDLVELHEYAFTQIAYIYWRHLGGWPVEGIQDVPSVSFRSPDLNNEYYEYDNSEPYWIYASWVEKETNPITTTAPIYLQPIWEQVDAVTPEKIASGNHATLWHGNGANYDAGLFQTIPVTATGALTVTVQVNSWANIGAFVNMRLGLDLNGGTDPESDDIVWSATAVNPTSFEELEVTALATGTLDVTLFLHAIQSSPNIDGEAIWDDVQLFNAGDLQNSDFEEGNYTYSTVPNIPNAWIPFYRDDYASGSTPPAIADRYTVHTIWSSDRGESWSEPEVISENSELAVGTTGAFGPKVFPIISVGTEPASVTFFYIYEKGDPPIDSAYIRFGRLFTTTCELGSTTCEPEPPGEPILSRVEARPVTRLSVVQDQQTPHHIIVSWSALQADFDSNDIFTSLFSLGAK